MIRTVAPPAAQPRGCARRGKRIAPPDGGCSERGLGDASIVVLHDFRILNALHSGGAANGASIAAQTGQVLLAAAKFMPFHAVRAFQMRQAQVRPAVQPTVRAFASERYIPSAARASMASNKSRRRGIQRLAVQPRSTFACESGPKGQIPACRGKTSRPRRSVEDRQRQLKGPRDKRRKRLGYGENALD